MTIKIIPSVTLLPVNSLNDQLSSVSTITAAAASHLIVFLSHSHSAPSTSASKHNAKDLEIDRLKCTLLRDNIKIEGLHSEDSLEGQDLFRMISNETSNAGCNSLGIKSIYPKHLCKKRCLNADISLPLSSVNWVLLFEMMLQIAVSNTEECVIMEAISIMNVILMSSNAQTETEKFGQSPEFESIAQLLRREAGLHVQKEAFHLLFLLLN